MDRELAGAVLRRWEDGFPVAETTFYKAASSLGIDPDAALLEARYYTVLDSYLLEKRAMTPAERVVLSYAAGISPNAMVKTASAHGFSPDELVLEALREQRFVPDLEKLANMSGIGGDPTVDPAMAGAPQDPAQQQAAGVMGAPPQQGMQVQQAPMARSKPSPMAPEQLSEQPGGNLDALLADQQAVYGQGAQENGGLPSAGMPPPPPPPPSPEERISQVAPNLDEETIARYAEQLPRFEEGIGMQISDPKQMVKFVKELQKIDGKRIDQGIKAMGTQLEQEQAQELGVDSTPTIDGPGGGAGGGGPMAQQQQAPQQGASEGPPQAGGPKPPGKAPPPPKPQPQQASEAVEKVAHVARQIARSQVRR